MSDDKPKLASGRSRVTQPRVVKTNLRWGELTDEAIVRIAEKMGKGCTREQACLSEDPEPVNPETHEKAIAQVPAWRLLHQRAMAKFVVSATEVLWQGDAGPVRRTRSVLDLLERRHREQWSRPAQVAIHNETTTNVLVAGLDAKANNELQARLAELRKRPAIGPVLDVTET